jgi:RimJ/RimL family protein N-acetyltransferase
VIDRGRPEDAAALAEVHVASWRQAYAGLLPESFLAALDPADRVAGWEARLRAGAPAVLLDHDGDRLAGFASFGACRDADAGTDWGELEALYYLEPYWGAGRAAGLLRAALDALRRERRRIVTLWVLRENARAIAFYRKHGFAFDGAEKIDARRSVTLHERRMRLG